MTKMLKLHEENAEKLSKEEFTWMKRLSRGLYYQKTAGQKSTLEGSGVAGVAQNEDSDIDARPYADHEAFYKNQQSRVKRQKN